MYVADEPRGASQLIEIPIPAIVTSKVQLPDVQQLRSQSGQVVIIKALRLISPDLLATSPTLGLTNATLAELQKISLTIWSENWERATLIPILELIDSGILTGAFPFKIRTTRFDNWQNVDWPKSYLQYSNGTPSSGAAYAVILEAEYSKFDDQGKPIRGAF